jgi:hypothetical protein
METLSLVAVPSTESLKVALSNSRATLESRNQLLSEVVVDLSLMGLHA